MSQQTISLIRDGFNIIVNTFKDAISPYKREKGRGNGLLEIPMPENFIFVFGAKPGS